MGQRQGFGQRERIRLRPSLLQLGEDRGRVTGHVRLLGGEPDPQTLRQRAARIDGREGLALDAVDTRPFERRAVFVDPDPAETERGTGQPLGITFGVSDLRVARQNWWRASPRRPCSSNVCPVITGSRDGTGSRDRSAARDTVHRKMTSSR